MRSGAPRVADLSRRELAARLAGPGLRLALPPFVFHIHSPLPVVAEGIAAVYAQHAVLDVTDSFADFHVSVRPQRRWFRPVCVFRLDGFQPFTPLAAGEAFAFLEWGMNWCITGHAHGWLTIHSAVLERGGRCLLLPAPPGSGKSTLCASLMTDGWRLLSDEMALLDPVSGLVTPAPRPVSLKNASIDLVRRRVPGAVLGPLAHDTMKGTVAHLRASADSLARAHEPALPAWVVFPQYQAGAPLTCTPHPKPQALVELAGNSFNQHLHGRRGFNALCDLIERSQVFDLRYSDLDEALPWFRELAAA